MDIKELLGKNSSELEKLTDAQLLEYFSPYMKFIVPVDIKDDNEKKSISELHDLLDGAVSEEDYEKAAKIRDEISKI